MSDSLAALPAGRFARRTVPRLQPRLALQGFGGVLPVAQRELVERGAGSAREQFVETAVAGAGAARAQHHQHGLIIGDRFFGWRGALAACAGLLLAPLFIVLVLAIAYQQQAARPGRGRRAARHGRGGGRADRGHRRWKLAGTLRSNPLGLPACAAIGLGTLALVGGLRWPMVWVVLGLGGLGMALAWWRLRVAEAAR
jgi:chromate transporter